MVLVEYSNQDHPSQDASSDHQNDFEENSVTAERFRCHICQDVMVEPTSVTCGHTFCRLCLARWSLVRNQPVCAVCQQQWSGLPRVNIVLRDAIKESLPETYTDRERDHMTQSSVIQRFDSLVSRLVQRERQMVQEQSRNRAEHEYIMYVMRHILPFVGLSLVIIVFSQWLGLGSCSLVQKEVLLWSRSDCLHWLETEGEWTEPIQAEFKQHGVDGVYLLAISRDLTRLDMSVLTRNVSDLSHRREFETALAYINEIGTIPPSDLWEYKDVHPLRTVWLVAFASLYPRLVGLYLYLWDYERAFLPAVNITSSTSQQGHIDKYTRQIEPATPVHLYWFLIKLCVCPWLVAWQLIGCVVWGNSPLAALALWLQCLCYLHLEIAVIIKFIEFLWARMDLLREDWNNLYRFHYTSLVFLLLSYFLPASLSNLFFSVMFINCVYLRITETVVLIRDIPRYVTIWIGYLKTHDFDLIKVNLMTMCRNKVNNLQIGFASLINSVRNVTLADLSWIHLEITRKFVALERKVMDYITYAQTHGVRDATNFWQTAYGYGLYIRTQLQRYLPNH